MKLGVLTVLYSGISLEETLKKLNALGVYEVELGVGGFPGNAHLNAEEILGDDTKAEDFKALLKKYNTTISALSVHGNPVHPNKEVAEKAHNEFVNACKVAKLLNVNTIITFSGCPGDSPTAQLPNWVTCAWPNDFTEILDYQWNEVLIPYWKNAVKEANSYGIKKIALEMHPGFCAYNPHTLLKLRNAVGDTIGANFDPSHLIWQGIDPVLAIRHLKGAIYHFHAKDVKIDKYNTSLNGVLDTRSYDNFEDRSWSFRSVGYGHDTSVWKEMISALRISGYDGAISIEHEDGLMSINEGLTKAIRFLQQVVITEEPPEMWWL